MLIFKRYKQILSANITIIIGNKNIFKVTVIYILKTKIIEITCAQLLSSSFEKSIIRSSMPRSFYSVQLIIADKSLSGVTKWIL